MEDTSAITPLGTKRYEPGLGKVRRRSVSGLFIGTTETGTSRPAVFIDFLGHSKVYFTPQEALGFADAIMNEALDALVDESGQVS